MVHESVAIVWRRSQTSVENVYARTRASLLIHTRSAYLMAFIYIYNVFGCHLFALLHLVRENNSLGLGYSALRTAPHKQNLLQKTSYCAFDYISELCFKHVFVFWYNTRWTWFRVHRHVNNQSRINILLLM